MTTTSVASHPHQCSTPTPCRHDFRRLPPRHTLQSRTTHSSTLSLRGDAGQCAAAEGIDEHPLSALHLHRCHYRHLHQKKTTKRISFHRGATHETTSPSSQPSKDMRCCWRREETLPPSVADSIHPLPCFLLLFPSSLPLYPFLLLCVSPFLLAQISDLLLLSQAN